MKSIVLYRSISGFTRKYAEWIAEGLGADLYDSRACDPESLGDYDLVVFGGSLHAVGINGIGIIKDNFRRLEGKRIIVFATGASPTRDNIPAEILNANFSTEQQSRIRFFYLRGGFDFGKLDVPNKILMTLMKAKLRMRPEARRSPDERGMLAAYAKPLDFTKKESIRPLLEHARSAW